MWGVPSRWQSLLSSLHCFAAKVAMIGSQSVHQYTLPDVSHSMYTSANAEHNSSWVGLKRSACLPASLLA